MSEHRMSKGETEYYTSFADLAAGWNRKPITKQTKDKNKLNEQRKAFCGRHLCKSCKQPMQYIGGNQMVCTNENCKGIKHERLDEETNEKKVWYTTSYELLDDRGAEIGSNIFSEL